MTPKFAVILLLLISMVWYIKGHSVVLLNTNINEVKTSISNFEEKLNNFSSSLQNRDEANIDLIFNKVRGF